MESEKKKGMKGYTRRESIEINGPGAPLRSHMRREHGHNDSNTSLDAHVADTAFT